MSCACNNHKKEVTGHILLIEVEGHVTHINLHWQTNTLIISLDPMVFERRYHAIFPSAFSFLTREM